MNPTILRRSAPFLGLSLRLMKRWSPSRSMTRMTVLPVCLSTSRLGLPISGQWRPDHHRQWCEQTVGHQSKRKCSRQGSLQHDCGRSRTALSASRQFEVQFAGPVELPKLNLKVADAANIELSWEGGFRLFFTEEEIGQPFAEVIKPKVPTQLR